MKQLSSSRLGASFQNVFGTEAFEQALGKHILEQAKPLPSGESALGRFNAPPAVQRRAGKAAHFYSKHEASIWNEYVTNVVDFLKTIDLSQDVQSGSGVLKVGDELVRYRVGTLDNPTVALFATKPGTSPTHLALSWQNRTLVRYRVKAPPPDVLKTKVTGIRLGKPGSRFTGHFSDSAISGGTGTQYVIPSWSAYLEEIRPLSSQGVDRRTRRRCSAVAEGSTGYRAEPSLPGAAAVPARTAHASRHCRVSRARVQPCGSASWWRNWWAHPSSPAQTLR